MRYRKHRVVRYLKKTFLCKYGHLAELKEPDVAYAFQTCLHDFAEGSALVGNPEDVLVIADARDRTLDILDALHY